jgi:Beta-galactosidase
MRRRLAAILLLCCLAAGLLAGAQIGSAKQLPRPPKGFFGIAPQGVLTDQDARYMKAGGIESVRWPMIWSAIQPTRKGGYDWSSFDPVVLEAARHGLTVLPFVLSTPRWLARKSTTLPIDSAQARSAWTAFLTAAVRRYGPGGEFWAQHAPVAPGGVQYEPAVQAALPIRSWQVWNEANFFYFAYPASPQRYARLLKISSPAIKAVDPGAKVILTGLFGRPTARGARGVPAAKFLEALYRTPGIKSRFDGVALHPYAANTEVLEEIVEELHEVTVENHDRVPLYITEMGWGSQNDYQHDAFEQGIRGQVKELRAAYGYLLENQRRLDLKQVYWYSWKDLDNSACDFCDSVGLFREGAGFHPKPAWHAFVTITGGRARP